MTTTFFFFSARCFLCSMASLTTEGKYVGFTFAMIYMRSDVRLHRLTVNSQSRGIGRFGFFEGKYWLMMGSAKHSSTIFLTVSSGRRGTVTCPTSADLRTFRCDDQISIMKSMEQSSYGGRK